ncbi:MAG TPA: histidinol-phosphate transaminase [Gammaproteobacteria bacterium]|nr:histidinol-phosphate transaminase [Gammaproteobacteria bacterium]
MAGCDFVALAAKGVRGLSPYKPGKPMEELQRELGLSDIIKLASNESPLGPGPAALAAVARCAGGISRYPDGNGFALKQALAAHHEVTPESITLGNGSNDVLELIARGFVTCDNEVVFSRHAFAVYPLVTQAVGAKAVVTPAKRFGHDLEAMAAAIGAKTRVVFIANPNNPTGTWLPADAVASFVAALPETVLAVVDEAYFEYVDEPVYESFVPRVSDHRNLIVTRTFSKAYGLAGLRVGYSVSDPQVADVLNRVRQPFNVNAMALAAAEAALGDRAHLERSIEVNRSGMKKLTGAFDDLDVAYIPSAGNFLAARMPRPGAEIFSALLKEGVIVRPIAEYGMPDFIRVTVGTEEENDRFIQALKRVISDW